MFHRTLALSAILVGGTAVDAGMMVKWTSTAPVVNTKTGSNNAAAGDINRPSLSGADVFFTEMKPMRPRRTLGTNRRLDTDMTDLISARCHEGHAASPDGHDPCAPAPPNTIIITPSVSIA